MCGLLSANLGNGLFDSALEDLQAVAGAPIELDGTIEVLQLPQVHAFNCLKDLFTDSRFGSCVEKHMATALELAVAALESNRYAPHTASSVAPSK